VALAFIGTAAFSGAPGELRWQDQGAVRLIQGNVNADTTADLRTRSRLNARAHGFKSLDGLDYQAWADSVIFGWALTIYVRAAGPVDAGWFVPRPQRQFAPGSLSYATTLGANRSPPGSTAVKTAGLPGALGAPRA